MALRRRRHCWFHVPSGTDRLLATLLLGAAMLVTVPDAAQAAPNFKAPFACNQRWQFQTWVSGISVRSDARLNASVVTTLGGPTTVWVLCQKQGHTVNAEGYTNNWWSRRGFIANIYIDHPASQLPGVPNC